MRRYKKFRRRRKIKINKLFIFMLVIVLFFVIIYKLDNDLKPIVIAMCDSEARTIATETINGTIRNEFGKKISYDNLMKIKTDKEGNVVMIQANTVELNEIGSEIALSVQKRVRAIGVRQLSIPLGVLSKNDIFSFYGPKIKFSMEPIGTVTTSYRSEFHSAGINQTRHVVYLDINAMLQVIIPLARNRINVSSSIPIAESIIVGKVPNTYANIDPEEKNGASIKYNLQNQK